MTESSDNEERIDDSKVAVFMAQPEEMPYYKSLRRVVDKVFLARDQFLISSATYSDITPGAEGVNRALRSILFRPAKRLRRGVKRSEVLGERKEVDGSGKGDSSLKNTQRQSKQKERCENRIMSLLFATIYDPATKQCRLVQDVPPLKLRRPDKNGNYRFVSNYTDVRLYLRNSMASILSGHTEGVKAIVRVLPSVFSVLPSMFVIIGRTFSLILRRETVEAPPGDKSKCENDAENAKRCIEDTMNGIQDYITSWERRNFTTDNRLTFSLRAGKDNECYASVSALLRAMVDVVTPSGVEPYSPSFRKRALYESGLYLNTKCKHGKKELCILGSFCPGEIKRRVREDDVKVCLKYVEALRACASMSERMELSVLDGALEESDFHAEIWNTNCSYSTIHRIEMLADFVRSNMKETNLKSHQMISLFVQEIRTDVARCWGAFGRSNAYCASFLQRLELRGARETRETIVELVFGGGIGATALFERKRDIIPICAKLRSKKGPHVVMMNEGNSEQEKDLGERDNERKYDGGLDTTERSGVANKEGPVDDRPTATARKEFPEEKQTMNKDCEEDGAQPSPLLDVFHEAVNDRSTQASQQQPVKKRKRRGTMTKAVNSVRKSLSPPKRKSRRRRQ